MWYWGRSSSKNAVCDCEGPSFPSLLAKGDSVAPGPPSDVCPLSAISDAICTYVTTCNETNTSRNRKNRAKNAQLRCPSLLD